MKKIMITAFSVAFFTAAFAQEKTVKVKNEIASKTEVKAEKGHTTFSESSKMDSRAESGQNHAELKAENATEAALNRAERKGKTITEVENTIEAENNGERLSYGVDKTIDHLASKELNTSNDHGVAVSAVAKSTDIIGVRGETVSEIASSKAVEVSPKVDNIKVGVGSNTKTDVGISVVKPEVSTSVKTNAKVKTNVNVKPIKVAPKVHVKNNLGIKL